MAISRSLLGSTLAIALISAAVPARAENAPDKVVATVNGAPIKDSDLVIAEQDLGSQLQSVPEAAKRDYLIRFLADLKLGAQAAEAAKLQDTPDFAARMQYYRDKILLDDLMVKEGAKADTPEARKKLYDDTVTKLPPETELHARHILVEDEAIAKQVAERAKKGEDFAALSKEFSKDPGSATDGGDLGWFTKDKMVKEFSDAAFKLEPGQTSDPVKSQFGWHVIKVEEKRTKPVPAFEEVKDRIGTYLVQKAQQEFLLSLREKAKIVQLDKPATPAPGAAGGATPAPAAPATPATPPK
ncbi:peptidyl-prolyl cis-trans isomerase C [Rhizobiales bacterium GAS113]|nr:peptidyl-prolyl cis-trans isomerase C [Rhizobiales bacterium GAS113]